MQLPIMTPSDAHMYAPVLMFDRSARPTLEFSGPKAAESLTGLVTNDVLSLIGGDGQYACALTPKGRIIADVRVLAVAGDDGSVQTLQVDSNATAGTGFAAMIRKYVNPRVAKYADVTSTNACTTLVGARAIEILASLGADAIAIADVANGPAFTHRPVLIDGTPVRLVRVPDLGAEDVFDLRSDLAAAPALTAALERAGARLCDAGEWHRRRVVAGRPEWGIDMDETTLAQEANMDALHAISYRKGCYTGQETVARVHFRGHVNRTLRRVEFLDGQSAPAGVQLAASESAIVGDTRSAALDDDGQAIGIAMLRREVPDGGRLSWTDSTGVPHEVRVIGAADDS